LVCRRMVQNAKQVLSAERDIRKKTPRTIANVCIRHHSLASRSKLPTFRPAPTYFFKTRNVASAFNKVLLSVLHLLQPARLLTMRGRNLNPEVRLHPAHDPKLGYKVSSIALAQIVNFSVVVVQDAGIVHDVKLCFGIR
jgi:hypothetical protein